MMADADVAIAPMPLDDTIARLLEVRSATASAGNRRALFAQMDSILATSTAGSLSAQRPPASLHGGGTVRLRRVRLRNWKAFQRADLAIPQGDGGAEVVLIGGANGFGKSSILEAYALCLFGRRAVSEAGFLLSAAASRSGQRRSYIELIKRALHRGEAALAEGVCGVTLEFDTEEGPVEVQRTWYFDTDGALIEDEEELLVRIGEDRHLPAVPAGEDPQTWHQAEIERLVLPAAVAPFLMFDGEQVERWSERKLSDQVRMAVTRMLGLDQLAGLATDLRDYARDRLRGHGDADASLREQLAQRIDQLESELGYARRRLSQVDGELLTLRTRRDGLLADITAGNGASHATLQTLLEEQHQAGAQETQVRRELTGLVADHGALIFAGAALRQRMSRRLDERSRRILGASLDPELLDEFWSRFLAAGPPMSPEEQKKTRRRIEAAWRQDGDAADADSPPYPHLGRRAVETVARHLADVAGNRAALARAVAAVSSSTLRLTELRAEVAATHGNSDRASTLRTDLEGVGLEIQSLEQERSSLIGQVAKGESALSPIHQEIGRLTTAVAEAEPRLRSAGAANSVAGAIEAQAEAIADFEHQRFANAVTTNFRLLSHKGQIERIEIGSDGSVCLRDGRARDVSDYRFSAGESQLFAMALIAAAGEIVGRNLPLIVDTPLGRLDTQHRESVLRMLAGRGAQTILLTQPEEMGARELSVVQDRLAGTITLDHFLDTRSGVGVSLVTPATRDPAEATT